MIAIGTAKNVCLTRGAIPAQIAEPIACGRPFVRRNKYTLKSENPSARKSLRIWVETDTTMRACGSLVRMLAELSSASTTSRPWTRAAHAGIFPGPPAGRPQLPHLEPRAAAVPGVAEQAADACCAAAGPGRPAQLIVAGPRNVRSGWDTRGRAECLPWPPGRQGG